MDFDNAKENIQPLATGRNVSLLQASLCQDASASQELIAQRKQLEENISKYSGNDPLEPWYAYICWIEQSYPAGGSGAGLQKVMHKCLSHFENDEHYKQDRRFINLFIKFMEKQEDQIECYQQMYNHGIGTMVADFYIAWAYSYDLSGNLRKADEIFRLGIACRAEPLEDLKEAHLHFGYTVGQRTLYSEGDEAHAATRELNERRLALQTLHGQRRKNITTVGSVRTGAAVKSHVPGVVQGDAPSTSRMRNAGRQVEVFNDENADINIEPTLSIDNVAHVDGTDDGGAKSSLRSIIDAARHQENLKEPGPWHKAQKTHKHGKLFAGSAPNDLAFKIHVDENAQPPITNYDNNINKPFIYPPDFVSQSRPQEKWVTPVTIEDEPNTNGLPCYSKCMLYPRPNMEFAPEEYRAYCYLKRRDSQHSYVLRNDQWWSSGNVATGVRRFPNFACASKSQPHDELDKYYKPPALQGLQTPCDKLYNDIDQQEYQMEELLAAKWHAKRNITVHGAFDMEETVCLAGEQMPRRKSFFPTLPVTSARKSLAVACSNSGKLMVTKEDEQEQKNQIDVQTPPTLVVPTIKIFDDSIPKPAAHIDTASAVPLDNFLVPTLPTASKKIEIYEDAALPAFKAPAAPTSTYFDADDTCSTQIFNVFLKSSAVSTPNAPKKQTPARQFGTVLKESIPPANEEPMEDVAAIERGSPELRKQLSTILEISEHGIQSSAATSNATTKSSNASTSSSSNAALTMTNKSEATRVECTPGPVRLQRQGALELSAFENNDADAAAALANFSRRDVWEPNALSVPLMKSLRFQEDKTETLPRPLLCFQEDRTETMPRLPALEPAHTSKILSFNQSAVPKLPIDDDDEDDFCGFFSKSPPPNAKERIDEQRTPDLFGKSMSSTQNRRKNSFSVFEDEMCALPAFKTSFNEMPAAHIMAKPSNSAMADLSYVPDTQPPVAATEAAGAALPKQFEIFLDETAAELPAAPTSVKCASFELNCTLPESQKPVAMATKLSHSPLHRSSVKDKENAILAGAPVTATIGPAHLTASFLKDCSEIGKCPGSVSPVRNSFAKITDAGGNSLPKFLSDSLSTSAAVPVPSTGASGTRIAAKGADDFFELNAATEMFAANISMIKNSTLLPETCKRSKSPLQAPSVASAMPNTHTDDNELSIYYKTTPVTPKASPHSWQEADLKTPPNKDFVHPKPNADQTLQLNNTLANHNINPFNVDLINSLLDSIEFSLYIEKLPTCELVGHVKVLVPNRCISVHCQKFEVLKMIGKGAYGSVFCGKNAKTGTKVAMKQERPTNYWEYYICLEVHSRLANEQMVAAYMHIDYALVGNNSSVFIYDFSVFGSLINVCNKIKKHTGKNVDEYVVMHMSCQLLDIIDNLHALGIIHADLKADNFLLMRPLCAQPNEISLQLIDFGVAIDTKLFAPNQTFNYIHSDDTLKCIEMRLNRPWTYQLDLFGLVGVIHVLLFGRYMEVVQRKPSGIWLPKTQLPRYINRQLWEGIFRTLLNVRDCRAMPDLQELRTLLKSELAEKEKYVAEAIAKFNQVLKL